MITYDDAINCSVFHQEGYCHRSEGPRGGIKEFKVVWRRNGATKTWKTRPGEFRLPIKHGLRSFGAIRHTDMDLLHTEGTCPLNDPDWRG